MMGVGNYAELIVWQKAMDLVEALYRVSAGFQCEELYGLSDQIRRAIISIPLNVAERQGCWSTSEFLQFLSDAKGSLYEVETQPHVATRFEFVEPPLAEQVYALSAEVDHHIYGLRNSLMG